MRYHFYFLVLSLLLFGCGNSEDPMDNPCANSGLNGQLIRKESSACDATEGLLQVTGSSPISAVTYHLNDGTSNTDGVFTNLAPNAYTVTIRDEMGCELLIPVTVESQISFQEEVEAVIMGGCAISGCHVTGEQTPDYSRRENIFTSGGRIKTVVSSRQMPPEECACPLSDEEIDRIICWVNGGSRDN